MCPLFPSDKPLEEQPMEESTPKVCLHTWVEKTWGEEDIFWRSWPIPALEWCPEPMVTWCYLAPGESCRGSSCPPHSNVAQQSDSSSAEFIQHIYLPGMVCCPWVQEHGLWATCVGQTCMSQGLCMVCKSSGAVVCFLNGSKSWKSTDRFTQFYIWALMIILR